MGSNDTQYPISLIAAVADNGVIGYNNQLPWHLPEDLAHFKKLTTTKPILMGRNTYESLGRPLPNRLNIVISRNSSLIETHQLKIARSLSEALRIAKNYHQDKAKDTNLDNTQSLKQEIMVIGGSQLYEASLTFADRIYITQVHLKPKGDCHFTGWQSETWELENKSKRLTSSKKDISYTFMQFKRSSLGKKV